MTTTPRFSRRALVGGAAASVGMVGLGAAGGAAAQAHQASTAGWGEEAIRPFYGAHQTAVEAPPTAFARFLTFDLLEGVDEAGIRRMLRIITEDSADLCAGRSPLADSEPELALVPANLMVMVGFGPELVRRAAGTSALPQWLRPLPPFEIDALNPRYTGGDLLVIVQADDPVTISHAARVLTRQTTSYLTLRWSQDGFRRSRGSEPAGVTMRNLFGQVDGTKGPHPHDETFARYVWGEGVSGSNPGWLDGGTGYVLRRIQMNLDLWDTVDRPDRERAIGRDLAHGAPLTGGSEHDAPDFDARDSLGLPVIPDFAHMRRAHAVGADDVIARRGYNYETDATEEGVSEAGLLFEAFAHDPQRQFVPIQQRLAQMDMMNLWTTPIGSAVYAIPPGCQPGGYLGDTLV
ncbi:MAG: Dyp-type peroxidase [Pontimonas sp.]